MKKHRRRWSVAQKLEILNYCKQHGAIKAAREFNVSTASVYSWIDKYEKKGEAGLSRSQSSSTQSAELKRLLRENTELKKLVAEKELEIRIQQAMLKKSR